MYTKILIAGEIEVLTGMHIGGSSNFVAIGAVDSPVVRDALTKLPVIPGSSLKGKMRYLLAKQIHDGVLLHKPNEDNPAVLRLFGSSAAKGNEGKIFRARLKFNDSLLSNADELYGKHLSPTEIKFENTIIRTTSIANPRQIERVISGSKFKFELFYEATNADEVVEDFENIKKALSLLEYDYLGGHGTRGSGRIKFCNLTACNKVGEYDKIAELEKVLEG